MSLASVQTATLKTLQWQIIYSSKHPLKYKVFWTDFRISQKVKRKTKKQNKNKPTNQKEKKNPNIYSSFSSAAEGPLFRGRDELHCPELVTLSVHSKPVSLCSSVYLHLQENKSIYFPLKCLLSGQSWYLVLQANESQAHSSGFHCWPCEGRVGTFSIPVLILIEIIEGAPLLLQAITCSTGRRIDSAFWVLIMEMGSVKSQLA